MTTARRGISNHEMLHWLEGYRQSLVKKGHSERDSLRCALALTFAQSGAHTREQAWADADAIMAKLPSREQAWKAADAVSKLILTTNPRGNNGQ